MKIQNQRGSIALTLFALLVAQVGHAAQPVLRPGQQAVRDVALQRGGALQGQLLDAAGTPRAKQPVVLLTGRGEVVASSRTDDAGRFAFANLRGGLYQVRTSQDSTGIRAWTDGAAPPAANDELLLVDSSQRVERGETGALLSNPWCWAALVALAIAVPVAVDQSDDDAT